MNGFRIMSRILSLLTSISLLMAGSCDGPGSTVAPAAETLAGSNQVEAMINNYEKLTNEYVRVSKKLKKGDVSITVLYIELGKRTREESARLRQESPKMTPQQTQRVASIAARTAPYLQE